MDPELNKGYQWLSQNHKKFQDPLPISSQYPPRAMPVTFGSDIRQQLTDSIIFYWILAIFPGYWLHNLSCPWLSTCTVFVSANSTWHQCYFCGEGQALSGTKSTERLRWNSVHSPCSQHRSWTFPEFHPPTGSILCRMSLSEGNKWMAFLRLKTFLSPHRRDAAQAERGRTEAWKCTWEKFSPAFVLQWSSLHHFSEHFCQLLLSNIAVVAKSDLSSLLCPSFIYFSLINGLYRDLELILTGFSFFSVSQNGRVHFYQDGNELPTNYILCSTSFQNDIIQMTTVWESSMH